MSKTDVLIDISEAIAPGTELELSIDWPGLYHGREMMHLFLIATLTRRDARGSRLRIVRHKFRDVPPMVLRSRRAEGNLAVA